MRDAAKTSWSGPLSSSRKTGSEQRKPTLGLARCKPLPLDGGGRGGGEPSGVSAREHDNRLPLSASSRSRDKPSGRSPRQHHPHPRIKSGAGSDPPPSRGREQVAQHVEYRFLRRRERNVQPYHGR